MSYHIFLLVYGAPFARRYLDFSLPYQLCPGNLPALANLADVTYHIYTDREAAPILAEGCENLAPFCDHQIHVMEDIEIRGASPLEHAAGIPDPGYRYELQRECIRHLYSLIGDQAEASIIMLDPNILISDGAFKALDTYRRDGYDAVAVTVLRLSEDLAGDAFRPGSTQLEAAPRHMMGIALNSLHHMTKAFFVDSDVPTPYPSQIAWPVGDDGFLIRAFLPHPLMVPVSPNIARSQSTMDYDMALRSATDERICMVADSDEILACKVSGDQHLEVREFVPKPSPENIGAFLLSATNHRHRVFADTPTYFHSGERHADFGSVETSSKELIDKAYAYIENIAGGAGQLNAPTLLYLKSFFGPIEEFMSPQMEPEALALIASVARSQ
ncbi:MAG: hypothetical protein HQ503_07815 [Rhodospirillales bacterium]|nr:hypothetical protein [Rhodospirillales bacterium]